MRARVAVAAVAAFAVWQVWSTHAAISTPVAEVSPAQTPGGAVTIHAARLIDGHGKTIENATIEVRDSKIVAIDQRKGPYTYDFPTATLLPGLIDVHTHFDWHFGPDGKYPPRNETPEQRDAAIAENLRLTIMAGFTTIQNVGNAADKAWREKTAAGTVPGPRILTSLGSIQNQSWTVDQIRERVRLFKSDGADLIKIFGSESSRSGGAPTLSQEQMDAACGEANAVGLRTLVHAHAAEAVMRATRAGCTQVEHGAYADQAALDLMKQHNTFFDPNIGLVTQNYIENKARYLTTTGSYTEDAFVAMEKLIPEKVRAFKLALATPGLRMPMGTDAVAGADGQNAREIVARVKDGGQKPMDAIIGATSLAAESMRMEKVFGSLTPGLEADIIAVTGNPLTDITAVQKVTFVMKGGKVIKK
jgi:imidazolonepropionase-like amidohydrolase